MFNLKESPIRKNIQYLEEGTLSIFEDESLIGVDEEIKRKIQIRTILKDVENMLETMESNKDKKIKFAVMGEVKAGKSTFINVCAGKEIAYTDILEATAIVSEITYAKEEYARVYYQDGSLAKDFSFEELMNWTEEMLDDMEDFSPFSKISIGVDCPLLRNMVLVDTPGLLSITSENHDVTNRYIAETDYVMWVINSRNLGSKAVNDFIDKIKLSGKPLIGIINKVDSESVLQEIREYVEKEYENVFEEIFFISAANAWKMMQRGEADWKMKSGFGVILDCIEDLSDDKEYSINKTQFYQLQREKEVHQIIQSRINARKKYYDNELATFAYMNAEMKKVIAEELENWYSNELYMEEKTNLLNADGEEFKTLFKRYKDAAYFSDVLERKYQEIARFIYKKWDMLGTGLMRTSSQVIIDFTYDKAIDDSILNGQQSVDQRAVSTEGAKEGMKKGAVLGLAFAGFEAWLGPAAAAVTFTEAVVPWVVPLVVGGAVLGSWMNSSIIDLAGVESNARKKHEYVEDFYKEILKTASKELSAIRQALDNCSDHYYEDRCQRYEEKTRQLNFDFTEPAYSAFCQELEQYMIDLDTAIQCGNDEIVAPPSMDGFGE